MMALKIILACFHRGGLRVILPSTSTIRATLRSCFLNMFTHVNADDLKACCVWGQSQGKMAMTSST